MIAGAFDPEHDPLCDRAKRTESYTKAFRELLLGTIPFPEGKQTLILRAKANGRKALRDIRTMRVELL